MRDIEKDCKIDSPRECTTCLEPTLTDNLLIVLPTAIGRMPSSFFLMPHFLAPKRMGAANCGTSYFIMTLTRSIDADRWRDPVSAESWATSEQRWPGQRPSGPREAQA